ncbi:cartilage acidic protein 1 isoform B [Patagioenas fasciata monilis]|uniref:Cartilage acidic protein 1 isoform B n=1 Tax=Patagioenas fasciata monilis TaxID=372326 RepID=A0A1V4KIU4_PATFA|nr:cartilage acidic protein 1 isoform B [Patagioenas fasciata monilis]
MRSRRRGGAGQPPWPVPRMLVLCLLSLVWLSEGSQRSEPMFAAVTHRLLPPDYDNNPTQLNYGVAITDLDADGDFEIVVAGYNGPNLVLKYDKAHGRLVNVAEDEPGSPYYALRDRQGNAIGVTACDIDGDGHEEIYFLNTNNAFSGMATYTDKLFKLRNGRWEDLLSDEVNRDVASRFAGRSVACVDRTGSGRYSIYIANYASGNVGPHALIEMDVAASDPARGIVVLVDVAVQAGVSKYTGGRGVAVGPILSDSASDIFCGNENSPNFLFHNQGDGTYRDVAAAVGLDDPYQHGRGVALADFNRDGRLDIVYGNWNGPHRLYLQSGAPGRVRFRDIATPKFSMPSPVRTVITADFDNDQELEVFFNNIAYRGSSANRLFRLIRREHSDPIVEELNPGDALEPEGRGTGGAVTDFDGDGMLDLILSHGESTAQPISIFKGIQGTSNNWLRVIPRTRFGAFARGAKVVLFTRRSGAHLRIIDGGSGYLCEMEPVAHFGLGHDEASSLEVTWPDGRVVVRSVASSEINSVLEVPYPLDMEEPLIPALLECGQGFSQHENGRCVDTDECTEFPFVCPRDKPVCMNTYGGYRCRSNKRCGRGYEPNEDGTACVAQVAFFGGYPSAGSWPGPPHDIDECAQGLHNCSQLCTNTPGAHTCHCHPGFHPLDPAASQCLDIDECQARPSPCDHICHNSQGSFHCHCYHHFSLGAGGRCRHN